MEVSVLVEAAIDFDGGRSSGAAANENNDMVVGVEI